MLLSNSSGIAVAYSHYIHKKIACSCFVCFAQYLATQTKKIPKLLPLFSFYCFEIFLVPL